MAQIKDQLLSKGRTESEAKKREGKEKWRIETKFIEEDFCDYTIINSHNSETNEWTIKKEELLAKFRTIFEEFKSRQLNQEECLNKILPQGKSAIELKRAYLNQKWLYDSLEGSYGLEEAIREKFGYNIDKQTLRNLLKEYRLQRWLDQLLMSPVNTKIVQAVKKSRYDQVPSNDMEIREELQKQYEGQWNKLEDPNNELVKACYQGLVNIVPFFEGETVVDRIKLLRSPYRDKNSILYRSDQDLLKRRLIEISSPYEYSI